MAETIGRDAKVPSGAGEFRLWAGRRICDHCWAYTHTSCRKGVCECPCVADRDEQMQAAVAAAFKQFDDYPPDWANIKYADELADFLDDTWNAKRIPKEIRDKARELRHKLDKR